MFTDIVGYTAVMGEDERKAFNLLKKNRQLQKPLIEQYGGKWIKELGDGILASFSTVSDAVLCACTIQQTCNKIPDLKLRIGIHLGEVVFEDNDVFGDGVNIASRLQALAPIGGIWVSDSVHKNIANKKGITSKFVREETLKNVKAPVQVYEVDIESFIADDPDDTLTEIEPAKVVPQKRIIVPGKETSRGDQVARKGEKSKKTTFDFRKPKIIIWGTTILVLALAIFLFVPQLRNKQRARNELIPQIQQLSEETFIPSTKAFDLAKEAEKYIPKDSALIRLWPKIAGLASLQTNPAGAKVSWKDYNDVKGEWKLIGKTPFKDVWVPRGLQRIKIEKSGFETIYSSVLNLPRQANLKLDSIDKLPYNMVKVPGSGTRMFIVGLEQYAGKYVNDFLMDRYEVTNKDFKRFVDAGGYENETYWDYPIFSEGKEIPFHKAIELFHDKTGKLGPASWEVGVYPDGKENHPVTGISWYEAVAYAKFAGKKLPTVYHWSLVADTYNSYGIIRKSNFNGIGTVPVGSLDGISFWGVYDIAGNAREWCFNETGKKGQRFILGGGWNDAIYAYNDAGAQSALDRSLSNGFRCMKELSGDTSYNVLSATLNFSYRDYITEKPVNDETFNVFLRQYAYDPSPLNSNVSLFADSVLCKVEKIDIDAAYNNERLTAYLYLPKNVSPPYQTLVFFTGTNAIHFKKFDYTSDMIRFDFILKSGRAVLYPIFKGTYERSDEFRSDLQEESVFYKEHVISWVKDISRSVDYLNTRKDLVPDKLGYYGFSWGAEMAPIVCAVEKRFKAAVLMGGGLMMTKTFPEVDPFNFLPRVKTPVLMLNGENDSFFPLGTSQKPMFNLLGTVEKKMIVYEGGHYVPKSELMKESLFWFDKYLGAVK
jgi:dienelactone hydrolase